MSPPDLSLLWQRADEAQAEAQSRYPEMRCLSGCNDCCKHHGSPITYAAEWQQIATWLDDRPEILNGVRSRFGALKQRLRERLNDPAAPSLSQALFELPCPFIDPTPAGERCAIYPVRPLTCRAFGNTLLNSPTSRDDLYTCQTEQDRWERELPMLSEVNLPLRGPLFEALSDDRRRSLLSFLERYLHQQDELSP